MEARFQACEGEKSSLEELLREQRSKGEAAKVAEAERVKEAEETLRLHQVGMCCLFRTFGNSGRTNRKAMSQLGISARPECSALHVQPLERDNFFLFFLQRFRVPSYCISLIL